MAIGKATKTPAKKVIRSIAEMKPLFFETPAQWRKWLKQHHAKEEDVYVGLYKKGSEKKSINWSQAVDQALCYGWIDGITRSLGEESYAIRFTPRRAGSVWSAVNINKVETLKEQGLMEPAGLATYEKRKEEKSKIYAFEQGEVNLDKVYDKQLKANKKAWTFFQSKGASYQKIAKWWIMSAKQEATRIKRLETLISDSEAGRLIPSQRRDEKKKQ